MTLKGYIQVCRPPLTILGGLAPAALLLWTHQFMSLKGFFIFLAVFLGNMGWTVMNEYFDFMKGIDQVNKPDKPLPSGRVDENKVTSLGLYLIVTSIVANLFLALTDPIYMVGFLGHVGSFVYNTQRKDLVGNVFMSLAYGTAALICLYPYHLLFPLAFALLTFAFNLAIQYQDMLAESTARVITAPQQLDMIGTVAFGFTTSACSFYIFLKILGFTGFMPIIAFNISAGLAMISALSLIWVGVESKVQELLNRYLGRIFLLLGFIIMIVVSW